VWFATTVLVMVGNLRVVDDLVAAGYSHTPTSSVPDVADHSLANSSVWYAAVAALVLVAAWRRRRHIGNRATIGALFTTVVIPPWIIPGAGVIVVAIVRVVQRVRAAID
jgi:MYXO-CTERM domain-containing protein